MEFIKVFRLILIGLFAILTVTVFSVYFLVVWLLSPIIGKNGCRYCKSFLMGCYLRFLRFIITDFKVILTGDIDKLEETKDKRCIYMQNHQTELDWLFCCYFLQMYGRESDFSAIMKGTLSKVPMFGWIVQSLGMCLLDRNWLTDQQHFKDFLKDFETHPRPLCVFFCPEGTTITRHTYERSQNYAKKVNRPVFEHLLLPHSTGLAFMITELKKWEKESGETVYLYDTTMQFEGYTGEIAGNDYTRVVDVNFPDTDNSFWSRRPINCHLHINVVPLTSIVSEEATDLDSINKEVEQWLDKSWMEKEKQLEYFTKHQTYDDDWSANRKVENFNTCHRLVDAIEWGTAGAIAVGLDYLLIKGVTYLFHWVVGLF